MSQQQQAYSNYSYYSMYAAPHTPYAGPAPPAAGPSTGYPQFYAPQYAPPNPNNPPQPTPYSYDAEVYLNNGSTQARRPRRANTYSNQQQPPGHDPAPLKSAMKKTITMFNNSENPAKNFFNSFNPQQPAAHTPVVRPRTYSNPSNPHNLTSDDPIEATDNPFHMVVSFHGYNELHIEHILRLALDEMRKVIWPLWPDGIESEVVNGHTCIARFRNAPWDLSGPNVKHTYKLITEFFRLFQQRGYSFQTAINVGTSTPRFLFQVTKPDISEFFLAYYSQDGRRLTLVNPPQSIELTLGTQLRSQFSRKISSVDDPDEFLRIFEIKRKPNGASEVDTGIFFVEVLRILTTLGFHLDAAIPFNRRGALGLGSIGSRNQREILVFKGIITGNS